MGVKTLAAYRDIEIIDSQVHIGPGGFEETKAQMDALGIQKVLIDEFWVSRIAEGGEYGPVVHVSESVMRPICPTAQLASQMYPDRFGYMLRIAFNDPEAAALMRITAADPGCKAFRVEPGLSPMLVQAFSAGYYDHIYETAGQLGKPVSTYLPDHPELIEAAATKFPDTTIIVDHCGLYADSQRRVFKSPYEGIGQEENRKLYGTVLELAKFPNLILKWSHYSEDFQIPAYPGDELAALLRAAIDTFGIDRIIWASDFSVNQRGETWGELLYSVLAGAGLSADELKAILGGNAARVLNW